MDGEYARALQVIDECVVQLREHYDMGYIVTPCGVVQALCETVAEIVGKEYTLGVEGVEFR